MSGDRRSGYARVYVGPAPDHGPHPGYRGHIELDGAWVHIADNGEYLSITEREDGGYPAHEWAPLAELGSTPSVPAARVDVIEWGDDEAAA